MDRNAQPSAQWVWRYSYDCTAPDGSHLVTSSEAEACFWHMLGYEVVRLLERAG